LDVLNVVCEPNLDAKWAYLASKIFDDRLPKPGIVKLQVLSWIKANLPLVIGQRGEGVMLVDDGLSGV
jgi:hypothetical protein